MPGNPMDTSLEPAAQTFVDANVRSRAEQGGAWSEDHRVVQEVTSCPWRTGVVTAAVQIHPGHSSTRRGNTQCVDPSRARADSDLEVNRAVCDHERWRRDLLQGLGQR